MAKLNIPFFLKGLKKILASPLSLVESFETTIKVLEF
jgi:hypothetical protein